MDAPVRRYVDSIEGMLLLRSHPSPGDSYGCGNCDYQVDFELFVPANYPAWGVYDFVVECIEDHWRIFGHVSMWYIHAKFAPRGAVPDGWFGELYSYSGLGMPDRVELHLRQNEDKIVAYLKKNGVSIV